MTYGQRIRPSFSILCHRGYYRKSSEVHHGDRQVLEELLLEIQIFCTCGRRNEIKSSPFLSVPSVFEVSESLFVL